MIRRPEGLRLPSSCYRLPATRYPLLNNDRPLERRIGIAVVVVKTAGPCRRKVPRLPALTGLQEAGLVHRRAVGVLRMRVRAHVVGPAVVVDEIDTSADGDRHRDRKSVV